MSVHVRLRRIGAAIFACATLSAMAAPAQAARIFFGSFNGDYGGATVQNINGADNELTSPLGIIGGGHIDLIKSGDLGVNCGAGFTSCISLEASDTTFGGVRTIDRSNPMGGSQFILHAGDAVQVTFSLSGNQRSDPATIDRFSAGVEFRDVVDLAELSRAGFWTPRTIDPPATFGIMFSNVPIASSQDFQLYTLNFVSPIDTSFFFQIKAGAGITECCGDGLGPILNYVAVDVTPAGAAPEPAAWALMLGGFGLAGGMLRRRRTVAA